MELLDTHSTDRQRMENRKTEHFPHAERESQREQLGTELGRKEGARATATILT